MSQQYWPGILLEEEGDYRGWDGWMTSPTGWTWVWASSESWWWTGKPGMLQSMESQRVKHDWAIELTDLVRNVDYKVSPKTSWIWTCFSQNLEVINVHMRIWEALIETEGPPRWFSGKESACWCSSWIPGLDPWQPTLVFLPGKSHGQRSPVGWSPWVLKWVSHNLADWTTTD